MKKIVYFIVFMLCTTINYAQIKSFDYDDMMVDLYFQHQHAGKNFITYSAIRIVNKTNSEIYLPLSETERIQNDTIFIEKGTYFNGYSRQKKIPYISYNYRFTSGWQPFVKVGRNDTIHIILNDTVALDKKFKRKLLKKGYYFSLDYLYIDSAGYYAHYQNKDSLGTEMNMFKILPFIEYPQFLYCTFWFTPEKQDFILKEYYRMPFIWNITNINY